MSYIAQSQLSVDPDFRNRVAACAATQEIPDSQPTIWADANLWWLAAAPTFADKYTYAVATGVEHPGADPAVISDGDILAAVQSRLAPEE